MITKVIVLAADNQYINQLTTTLKSILFNNNGVKVYVLNPDIPQEWFLGVNNYVNQIGDQIVDYKYQPDELANVHNIADRVSNSSYARFLISDAVAEDKALYLDSDLIVDGSLNYHSQNNHSFMLSQTCLVQILMLGFY
ncbi:glycosyltransferase [Limosilactobacillus kribbianus]|uniref:glycosyltransferase n=1 Tax=Limosilactobacillus kribbianus TaxID=2982695 RepID=UPI002263BB7E|nr:glycosyltransferase [Limosilactobacillus kribbianus]